MKRRHSVFGPLAVIVLALTACSSSGTKTLSDSDFVGQLNAICRTADRDINKLDASSSSYVSDAIDIMTTGLDSFNKLTPPKALKADFDDFKSNLDDSITQAGKLKKAIKAKDDAAAKAASDKLAKLSTDGDKLADSLGATKCVGVGAGGATTTGTEVAATGTATPNTPLPIDSTIASTIASTQPPIVTTKTSPPTASSSEMTSPPNTSTTSTGGAVDASLTFAAPAGYEWGQLTDLATESTPAGNSVLGPVVDSYFVGLVKSTSGGTGAIFYITYLKSGTEWNQPLLDAYFKYEYAGQGTAITTSKGFPGKQQADVVEGYDAALFYLKSIAVAVIAPKGADTVGLLDAFATAQAMAG